MKQAEITGKIGVMADITIAAEHETDGSAALCAAAPLTEFVELLAIERVRDHVIHGHHDGKGMADHVARLSEKVGDVAAAYGEFRDGENGAFEEFQVGLIDLAAATAVIFERTWVGARAAFEDFGTEVPVLAMAPEGYLTGAGLATPAAQRVMVVQETADQKPIIAFTGGRGAGKDSVAKHLIERYGYQKGSFAAPLKRLVAAEYGFDLARLEELDYKEEFVPELGMTRRELLIKVGTEWFRSVDPLHWIKRSAPDFHRTLSDAETAGLVVTDLRFENELTELRRLFPKNPLVVVRVVRTDAPTEPNADDAINAWRTIPADLELSAAYGQLPLLYAKMDAFMRVFETSGVPQ